jgi:Arc/MetJ-type ribon-helix-helix transcriptional regulator
LGRSKSDLVRQAVHELCQKFAQDEHSAYAIGQDLFDAGELSVAPDDSVKQQIWHKLRDKHAIQMSDK